MRNPWKVGWSVDTIYWWGCKKNYGVYRLINPNEPGSVGRTRNRRGSSSASR